MQVCSICHDYFDGYGNNAEPVNNGRCCDVCNTTVVIPARLTLMFASKQTRKEQNNEAAN